MTGAKAPQSAANKIDFPDVFNEGPHHHARSTSPPILFLLQKACERTLFFVILGPRDLRFEAAVAQDQNVGRIDPPNSSISGGYHPNTPSPFSVRLLMRP